MRTITFESLGRKYEIAKECMASNLETIENPNYPEHAKWIHHPTMVRWLYGSSQEFLADFNRLSLDFQGRNQEDMHILEWREDLTDNLNLTRQKIRSKYSENVEIIGELQK